MKQSDVLLKEKISPEVLSYIESLQTRNQELAEELAEAKNENLSLREQLSSALRKRFCPTAEKFSPGQGELFGEELEGSDSETANACQTADDESSFTDIKAHSRKKPGRKRLSSDLPRKEIIIDIPEEEKQCACGCRLSRIGEERTERLQVTPAQFYVEETVRPKYACRSCEGSGDEDKPAVRVAAAEKNLLPGSIATAGLLSFVFINKFCDHLPYYRQEKAFERLGVSLGRQDMSNWQRAVHEKLLPLEPLLIEHLKTGPYIQMDETTVQVMGEQGRQDTQKSYMWLARGGPPDAPVIIYRYHPTRSSIHIDEFISGYSGFLQSDGYKGYKTAVERHQQEHPKDKIIHVGCLAHARRYFYEASKLTKSAKIPEVALSYIRKIYQKERLLREQHLAPDKFLEERRKIITPLLDAFHEWLEEKHSQIPPSQKMGQAVTYALSEWNHLTAYLECPDLTPDNNLCENAIRPFVIGRKNWLFAGSPNGANSSCFLYTLIETAKQNRLNPGEYLTHLFCEVPFCASKDDWQKLLPWNVDINPYTPKGMWRF